MSERDRIKPLTRLLALRAQRVETERRAVAAAQAVVAHAEAAVAARKAAIAALDQDLAKLDQWFASGAGGDARLIENGLSRRGLIADRRIAETEALEADRRALDVARSDRDEAVQRLMRADARHDAVDSQLKRARTARAVWTEAREHEDYEDRARPQLKLVIGGRR